MHGGMIDSTRILSEDYMSEMISPIDDQELGLKVPLLWVSDLDGPNRLRV